jgi:hypothetical protein
MQRDCYDLPDAIIGSDLYLLQDGNSMKDGEFVIPESLLKKTILADRGRLLEEIYALRAKVAELERAVALGKSMVECMEANP